MNLEKLSKSTSLKFAKNIILQITNKILLKKDDKLKKQAQNSKNSVKKAYYRSKSVRPTKNNDLVNTE